MHIGFPSLPLGNVRIRASSLVPDFALSNPFTSVRSFPHLSSFLTLPDLSLTSFLTSLRGCARSVSSFFAVGLSRLGVFPATPDFARTGSLSTVRVCRSHLVANCARVRKR